MTARPRCNAPARAEARGIQSHGLAIQAVIVCGLALAGCTNGDQTLARFRDERITRRDLSRAADQVRREHRDAAQPQPADLLSTLVARRMLLAAGRDLLARGELRLAAPEARNVLARRGDLDGRFLDAIYAAEVAARVPEPSPESLRAEWGRQSRTVKLERADLAVLEVGDSAVAVQVARALRVRRSLAMAIASLGVPLKLVEQTIRFPSGDAVWGPRETMLALMHSGQVRPLRIGHRWLWVEMLAARQAVQSFDALQAADLANLRAAWIERASGARFSALMDSLSRVFKPELHPELLVEQSATAASRDRLTGLFLTIALAALFVAGTRPISAYIGNDGLMSGAREFAIWRAVLVIVLLSLGVRYAVRGASNGWDFENYHRAATEMRAGLSPYEPATIVRDAWDPATPFLYAPSTLWIFRPFADLSLKHAMAVWFAIQLAAGIGLVLLARTYLGTRWTLPELLALMLFGFNGALLLSMRVANVATIECLLLWAAFAAMRHTRLLLAACLIAVAALFKLLPIVFLVVLVRCEPARGRRWIPVLVGGAVFTLGLALPGALHMTWASGFLRYLEPARPFGEVNPSSLGLADMLWSRTATPAGQGWGPWIAWCLFDVGLIAVSGPTLLRLWRAGELGELAAGAAVFFLLLSPRPVLYGYQLTLAPAMMLVSQLWPEGPARRICMLALIGQGLYLRGALNLDFLGDAASWPLSVAQANLSFGLLLALWLMFIRRSRALSGTRATIPNPA